METSLEDDNRALAADEQSELDGACRTVAREKECLPVKFGFCVMANIDEIGFFPHVEALG
ncbi:MAG TPA: hypothetical protein VFW46_15740 [Stellaceae bacterium]|nr:hypothetical protein [Stellaceae bacterium]